MDQKIKVMAKTENNNSDLEMDDAIYDHFLALAKERQEDGIMSFLSGAECMMDYIKTNFNLTHK